MATPRPTGANRLRPLVYRRAFAADAVVYHRHRETIADFARTKARAAKLWVEVYRAHPSKLGNDSRQPRLVIVQIGLAAAALGFGAAGVMFRPARMLAGVALGALLASSVPLAARAWRDDPAVAAVVPLLTWVRATSQAAGIALGAARRGASVLRRP
jgi:hypothetical protein